MKLSRARKNTNSSLYDAWLEFKSFSLLILLAISIRIFIFEPFYIPSGSMKKTLMEGDYVFATKYSYGYSKYSYSFIINANLFSGRILPKSPQRGDVIIFRPPNMMHERYIKRLVGLPGEKIELKNGVVYINNLPIKRDFKGSYSEGNLIFEEYEEILENGTKYQTRYIKEFPAEGMMIPGLNYANNIGPFFIPEGHYFFLGDNRDESGDSRFQLGFVPFENLIAKAQFIFFAFDERLILDNLLSFEQVTQVGKWIMSFKFNRFFAFKLTK